MNEKIIVIGAGAAGMMAAGRAAEKGASVLLLEKTGKPGQKVLISGNGRCNISNTAPLQQFIVMYGSNGPFLYGAFKRFFRDDLLIFFKGLGVVSAEESDGRIFPASGKAADVLFALRRYMSDHGVRIEINTPVSRIRIASGKVKGVETGSTFIPAEAVILAAGGSSYSKTGSCGDGYRMAARSGHTIVPLRPALVPLVIKEKALARGMQGASLHDAKITAFRCRAEDIDTARIPDADTGRGITGKAPRPPVIESRTGDIIFTHFGISGPCVLKMSLAVVDALSEGPVSITIDLRPHQAEIELRQELIEGLAAHGKKTFLNFTRELMPPKMAETMLKMTGANHEKLCHQVSAGEREKLLQLMKSLRFNIASPLSMDTAMVTAGGVSLKEIDSRTMSSLLVEGLYICGEVLDLDAETGGFNLQSAFSTGYLSGESAEIYVAGL